jgi:N-acetylmuramoyl-L-alanine amidase
MYKVKFYTGDYHIRQKAANLDKAVLYLEGHANSSTSVSADYSMAVVATNHSKKSYQFAVDFARECGSSFKAAHGTVERPAIYGADGVRVGDRGNGNLALANMPAVLLEPVFASNPHQAEYAESDEGLDRLAGIINSLVRLHFPKQGLIAFSIGHIGKTSQPKDRGAAWVGKRFANEASYVTEYMKRAAALLSGKTKC